MPTKRSPRRASESATRRATEGVRRLIMEHRMLPGQQVRQEEIAAHLGLSRSPLREALRTLEAEGLLVHSANHGYFVVRLSAEEMKQVYLLRRLIEAEVLRQIRDVAPDHIASLKQINDELREAMESDSISRMLAENRRFHFAIFDLSDMKLAKNYLEQLWHLTESYRATYLWLSETRTCILNEHEVMIAKIEAGDSEGLIEAADAHRSRAEARVIEMLPPSHNFRYY